MASNGENIRHLPVGELIKGRPALPTETRVLLDVALSLFIVSVLLAVYVGYSMLAGLGKAAARFEQPGPAPTPYPTCVNHVDPLTGADC